MEVPWPGINPMPQQQPKLLQWQFQILNPLYKRTPKFLFLFYFCYLFIYLFLLFRPTPVAYGSSQAGGWIRVKASSLCHSHSSQQHQIPNQTCIFLDTSRIHFHCSTMGTPEIFISLGVYLCSYSSLKEGKVTPLKCGMYIVIIT